MDLKIFVGSAIIFVSSINVCYTSENLYCICRLNIRKNNVVKNVFCQYLYKI